MKANKGYIKCRFCNWRRKATYKTKSGKFRTPEHAHIALRSHVEYKHPEIIEQIDIKNEGLLI